MTKGTILLIDDEEKLRKLLGRILELEGYQVRQAPTATAGLQELETHPETLLVLTDVRLPDGNGLGVLEKIKTRWPACEVIVMTAYGTIHDGVRAMKLGAFDYITKGDQDEQMLLTVEKAVEKARLRRRVAELESRAALKFNFDSIIGTSDAIRQAVALARKVAPTDTSVLLEGETGTGKELFAQAIHAASTRPGKPFVAVNCSAFPREMLESEMFGYRKGAFTGAVADKKGLFEEASGGTLFLDEIGEMTHDLQAKLLRVLEVQSFTKLGDTKSTHVNVRIVAATNRNLLEEAHTDHFRADLYYRLSVFKIRVPALRERKEDIGPLATFFCQHYAQKMIKRLEGMHGEFTEGLERYDWKGNIRELKNVLERAVILADGPVLTADLLPAEIRAGEMSPCLPSGDILLANVEKNHILKVLAQVHGNKPETARLLGIGLTTLYRKLHEYGIEA
jgi:DNA-binding NtrC family response regulator